MFMRFLVVIAVSVTLLANVLNAQDQPRLVNPAEMKFQNLPGTPACAQGALQSGDPSNAASLFYIKFSRGCAVPLHWHTPNEQLLMVSGTGKVTPHPGKAQTLQPGGYASMPSKHHHVFSCAAACSFYLSSDGAFDIHYVDASGKEISPEEAMKKGKKAAKK